MMMKRQYPKNRKSRIVKDLSGKKFGRLLVIKNTGKSKQKCLIWECLCDCGNIHFVETNKLNNGHTRSCGCLKKEQGGINADNLVGKKYNRLLVIMKTEKRVFGNIVWLCLCDCGEYKEVTGAHLKSGHTKSCGCYNHETQIENGLKTTNLKVYSELIKKYPPEAYLLPEHKRSRLYLADYYVRSNLLRNKICKGLTTKDIVPKMIKLKRQQIMVRRALKQLKEVINE